MGFSGFRLVLVFICQWTFCMAFWFSVRFIFLAQRVFGFCPGRQDGWLVELHSGSSRQWLLVGHPDRALPRFGGSSGCLSFSLSFVLRGHGAGTYGSIFGRINIHLPPILMLYRGLAHSHVFCHMLRLEAQEFQVGASCWFVCSLW